jgi:hypothetical protein
MEEQKQEENKPVGSLIDNAKAIAEKTEKLIQELKKENDRTENLRARDILGGNSIATNPREAPKINESPKDYVKRVMRGDTSKK